MDQQTIESLQLSPRTEAVLKEHGINTWNQLAAILSGLEQELSFFSIEELGGLNRIDIMHKAIRNGIITADRLGKHSKCTKDVQLWECYRIIMGDQK